MRKSKLFFLFLFYTLSLSAIDAPQLRCLSVQSTGAVTLTWLPPADLSDFDHYAIYYSTASGGPYTMVAQIADATVTTYTHTGAQAMVIAQCWYYVEACSFDRCVSSDTLATIEFYLANYGNGEALLSWEAPCVPLLPSMSPDYEIWREFPDGVWTNIVSTNNRIYRDIIDICESSLSYRIELSDASGCKNVSRPLSDIFSDFTSPETPQLDSVSVDFGTQLIQLGWEPSSTPDVTAYIIYHKEGNMWISVDTVYGDNHNFWYDSIRESNQIQHYRIAAMDSCLNTSPMTDAQHNFTLIATYDICRREASLSWNAYENMPFDVEKYQIYVSDNGAPLQYVGETTGLSYVLSGLIPQHSYQCVIRAVNYTGNVTALSAQYAFDFEAPENHDMVYISSVSVVQNAKIEVKVYTGETENFSQLLLYRSIGDDSNFVLLQALPSDGGNSYLFEDEAVKVDRFLYYYKAVLLNECDAETAQSNISHNILLKGHAEVESRENMLEWNSYQGWNGDVAGYTVYRLTETSDFPEIICPSQTACFHSDDIYSLRREGGTFRYFVEAHENPNAYGLMEVSRSNTLVVEQAPVTYIPNAFAPWNDGPNSVFLPIHSFVGAENYDMYIYSRDGLVLFHTQDPQMGWNGGYNGNLMPAAVYVYKITYIYRETEYEYVGTVTLIR